MSDDVYRDVRKVRVETHLLPVPLTAEEKEEMAAEMAEAVVNKRQVEAEKKARAEAYNEQIKDLDGIINSHGQTLNAGTKLEYVECEWNLVFYDGVKRLVRIDTGEVVKELPLSSEDRQDSIL